MKIINVLFSIITVLFFCSFIGKQIQLLTYTESSSGLQSIQLESGRTDIKFADVNNDGFKDILSVGDHGNPYVNTQEHGIMIWFGNGTGANWNLYQFGSFGYGGIAIGDVNNDGKQDVGFGIHHNYATSGLGTQILEVGLGDGTGMNWVAYHDSLATHGETWGMFNSDFADVDNDGLLDLGSVSFGCCAGVHIYKNLGTGTWRQTFGFTGGNATNMEFIFGDMNNDGNIDFAVSHQYGTPYFGDGTGYFTLKHNNLPSPGTSGLRGTSLGDVDNDGAKELAFISTGGGVNVWKWNNSTQLWVNLSGTLPASSSFERTALYDMNNDGYCDLILFGNGNLTIYGGNGGTNWTQIATFTTPSNGYYVALAVADVDNNGFADIAIESHESVNTLRLYKETTPYTSLSVTPRFPRGNERFKNHSVQFIEWISSAPQIPLSKIKLELSSTGNSGPWTLIADSLLNSGRYQWTVPLGISSSNCFIRYTIFNTGGSLSSMNTVPFSIGIIVNLKNNSEELNNYNLFQNYPNPFNPSTIIKFMIAENAPSTRGKIENGVATTLKVFNVLGKEIATLLNKKLQPGTYEVLFSINQFSKNGLPSGIYYYRLETERFSDVKRMILIK